MPVDILFALMNILIGSFASLFMGGCYYLLIFKLCT